jgi:hypothetical protein
MTLNPHMNYTDSANATSRRILVPTFVERGVSLGQHGGTPTAVNLSFLDHSCHFFFQVDPYLSSRGWVDPVPDPLLLRKSGSARNRTRDVCVWSQKLWPLDHTWYTMIWWYIEKSKSFAVCLTFLTRKLYKEMQQHISEYKICWPSFSRWHIWSHYICTKKYFLW